MAQELAAIDPKLWNVIAMGYDSSQQAGEMVAYIVQQASTADAIEDIKKLLTPVAQTQLNEILDYIGYGRQKNIKDTIKRFNTTDGGSDIDFLQTRIRNVIRRGNEKIGRNDISKSEGGNGNVANIEKVKKESEQIGDEGILFRDGESDGTREEYDRRVKTTTKKLPGLAMTGYNFMEAFFNELRSVEILQDIIKKKYGLKKLPSYENVLDAENRLSSMNLQEFKTFVDGIYEKLMSYSDKWIRKGGETQDSINRYMIAKSGLERNREFTVRDAINERLYAKDEKDRISKSKAKKWRQEYVVARNALLKQFKDGDIDYKEFNRLADSLARRYAGGRAIADYSGLSGVTEDAENFREKAEQIVLEFESRHGDDIKGFWESVNECTKASLKKSYASGLLTKELYEHLNSMFEWYVPMRGFDDNTAEDVYSYIGADTGVFNPTVASAKGHTEVSQDALATIANMMQSAILQGNRNRVKQHLLRLVRNHPVDVVTESEVWLEQQADGTWKSSYPELSENMTGDEVAQAVADHEKKMEKLAKDGKAKMFTSDLDVDYVIEKGRNRASHTIDVMLNGEHFVIYVNGNPRVAQALNGELKNKSDNTLLKMWKKWTRYYSAMRTSWSIDFVVPNANRDIHHSLAMTFMEKGFIDMLKLFINGFTTIYPVIKGISGKRIKNDATRKYFEEFLKYGGETGYSHLNSVDDWVDMNKRRLQSLGKLAKVKTIGKNTFNYIGKGFEFINRIAEDSTRFNVYVKCRKGGMDIADSIRAAKDISVNFNQKGSDMTPGIFGAMAQVYRLATPFANPILQGLYRFLKVAKEHKARFMFVCAFHMGLGFVVPLLNEALFASMGGDDEDEYLNQPDFTRRNNLMIYTGGGYIKIPLAPMFRELYGFGDILYSCISGAIDTEDATMETIDQIRSMFSLEGQSSYQDKEWSATRFLMPDQLSFITDIEQNTNFTGAPIYKDGDFINERTPEYKKVYNGTWSWLVELSRETNILLGGTDDKAAESSGKWLNPAVWQHVLSELGGGPLKTVGEGFNLFMPDEDEFSWSSVPIAKRYYQETGDRAENRIVNERFWDAREWNEDYKFDFNVLKNKAKGDIFAYGEILADSIESPNYWKHKYIEAYIDGVNKLNKAINEPNSNITDKKTAKKAVTQLKKEMLEGLPKVGIMSKYQLDNLKDSIGAKVEAQTGHLSEWDKEANWQVNDAVRQGEAEKLKQFIERGRGKDNK